MNKPHQVEDPMELKGRGGLEEEEEEYEAVGGCGD